MPYHVAAGQAVDEDGLLSTSAIGIELLISARASRMTILRRKDIGSADCDNL
jgi:hypothetical protein